MIVTEGGRGIQVLLLGEAAAIPLPREETTPPVTNTNFVILNPERKKKRRAFWRAYNSVHYNEGRTFSNHESLFSKNKLQHPCLQCYLAWEFEMDIENSES